MLYYIHIPKTAGTSFRSFLKNAIYGDKLYEVYADVGYWNAREYRLLIRDYKVFFGHFSFGFHTLLKDTNPSYVTILRDPIARIVSFYKHQKLIPDAPWHNLICRENLSLRDFIESCITHETNNHMVRILSADYGVWPRLKYHTLNTYSSLVQNRKSFLTNSRKLLRRACRNIERDFLFVGTTDRIDRAAVFIADFHRINIDTIKVPVENVLTLEGLVLDRSTRMAIENSNELDLELYDRISKSGLSPIDPSPIDLL